MDNSQLAPEAAFAANLAIGVTAGALTGGITGAVKADSLPALAEKAIEGAVEGAQKKILQGVGGEGGAAFDRGDITPSDIADGARTGVNILTDFVNRKLDLNSPSAGGPAPDGPAPSPGLSELSTAVANLPKPGSLPAPAPPPPGPTPQAPGIQGFRSG